MSGLSDLVGVGIVTIGAGALGVQYLRGKFPYIRNKENVYLITRWFTGHRGPALKPLRTSLYLPPFIRIVKDKEGNNVTVSGEIKDRDSKFHFRTNDNFEGTQKIQYTYMIPNDESAKKFYWKIKQNIGLVDEIVHAKIAEEIGKRNADDLPKEQIIYAEEVQKKLGKIEVKESEQSVVYRKFGVLVTDIFPGPINFDPESQRILSLVQEAKRLAEARKIKSDAEFYATQVKARATKQSLDVYMESAKEFLDKVGIKTSNPDYHELLYNQVNHFYDIDNYQTMAENGGTIVIGGSSKERIVPLRGGNSNTSKTPNPPQDNGGAPKEEENDNDLESNNKTPKKTIEDILGI